MEMNQAVIRFVKHAADHQLFGPEDRVLLAVSGGRDSMCMLKLFEQTDQPIGVAHMNFQLRDDESARDADFVRNYCSKHDIAFHLKDIDCREYMAKHDVGIQEAARDLRYAWMHSLQKVEDYNFIATGHHQDDNVETFMINLMRGTGIRGLAGIPVKRSEVIRPLMCFHSQEIQSLVEEHDIKFCQDSSNDTDIYLRNRIRHHLIPLMNQIHPGTSQNLIKNIQRIKGQWESIEAFSGPAFSELSSSLDDNGGSLQLENIRSFPSSEYLLFRIVSEFGFSVRQCASILQSEKNAGIRVCSETHEMILDRDFIRIDRITTNPQNEVHINVGETVFCGTGSLEMSLFHGSPKFSTDPNIEYIDSGRLKDGATIRTWEPGDKLSPLGMNGSQKVSDLLTNLKFSSFQKRKTLVLVNRDEVIWVIGVRLSDHYRVKTQSKDVIRLLWTPSEEPSGS